MDPDLERGTTLRAAARGLVAAMAMTGTRVVTENLGLLEESPPDAIARGPGRRLVARLGPRGRAIATEVAHWAYGASAGAAFGLLPPSLRSRPGAGPVYGLAIWLVFEAGIAPLIGVQYARHRSVAARATLAADHVLYGVVVAGRLAPEPAVRR